jgi:hypothetical protein
VPLCAPCSKVVRKSIARVHTVYRANIRSALRSKITNDGANKKGRVSRGEWSQGRNLGVELKSSSKWGPGTSRVELGDKGTERTAWGWGWANTTGCGVLGSSGACAPVGDAGGGGSVVHAGQAAEEQRGFAFAWLGNRVCTYCPCYDCCHV